MIKSMPEAVTEAHIGERAAHDIIDALEADLNFSDATTTQEKCSSTCTILQKRRQRVGPFSMIPDAIGVSKGCLVAHWKILKIREVFSVKVRHDYS
jgi:predicted nucleic acid-binding Zn ribbon protein